MLLMTWKVAASTERLRGMIDCDVFLYLKGYWR